MKRKIMAGGLSALLAVGALTLAFAAPASASDAPPIVVGSVTEAPQGTVWTTGMPDLNTCTVEDLGVYTQEAVPEKNHQEYQYERTVQDFKTQYHLRKFTQTKTRTWVEGTKGQKAQVEKFTWAGPYAPEVAPPSDGWTSAGVTNDHKGIVTDTILHQGGGNGSYFYFKKVSDAVPGTPGHWTDWSAYGDWTPWEPETHTSWSDVNEAAGEPAFHGQGGNKKSGEWYRQWQARPDGQTREVPAGTHVEKTDWLTATPEGEGWTQVAEQTVIDSPAVERKVTTYSYTHAVENCAVPVACTATGSWYSEDGGDPAVRPKGIVFTATGHAPGLDYRVPVTGNLQGWDSLAYTATGSDQLFPRLVISSPADGFTYKSLSFPATNPVTQDSVAYQTGKSIKQMAEQWPHAVITSVGFSMNSGATAGDKAVLTSVASPCITKNFVVKKPDAEVAVTHGTPIITCDNKVGDVVKTTDTTTTTPYVWRKGEFVLGTPVATTKDVEYTVTQADIDALECAVVTPPVVTPPAVTPPAVDKPAAVVPASQTLAHTGGTVSPWLFGVAGLLLLGGAACTVSIGATKRNRG